MPYPKEENHNYILGEFLKPTLVKVTDFNCKGEKENG
jgi:hypothetical protein